MTVRLLAGVAMACGLVLFAGAAQTEAVALAEWLGLGPKLGLYLVLLSGALLATGRTGPARVARSIALAGATVAAAEPLAASHFIGGLEGPTADMDPPWPAVGLLALAAAAVVALQVPLRVAQWVVPVLLVAPYVAALGSAILVLGLWAWANDWAPGGIAESALAATGLVAASTAVLLQPSSRSAARGAAQAGPAGDRAATQLSALVSVSVPVVVGLCALVAGAISARQWAVVDIERSRIHLLAHAEGLAQELARLGVYRPALGEPEPRDDAAQTDAFIHWKRGQWWLTPRTANGVAGPSPLAAVSAPAIQAIFASARHRETIVELCEVGTGLRCWIQKDGDPVLVGPAAGSTDTEAPRGRLSITADIAAVPLSVTKLHSVEALLAGASNTLHALLVPALVLAGAGSLLTLRFALPLVRRLDRLHHDLDRLVAGLPAAVVVLEANGRVRMSNAAAKALLDGEVETSAAAPLRHIAQALAAPTAEPSTDQDAPPVAVSWSRPDGSVVHVEASALALPGDESGAEVLLIHDVTRRQHAEEGLVRAVAWRDGILETAGEGICVIDAQGGLTLANQAARLLLKLPPNGQPAQCAADGHAGQESERMRAVREAVCGMQADHLPQRGEIALRGDDVDEVTIEFVAAPLADPSGSVVIVFRDVSAERRHAQALELATSMLQRTEEVGLIGGWHLDLATGIQVWSEGKYRIHGLPNGTEPSSELHIQYVHPDDRDRLDAVIREALATHQPHEVRYRMNVGGSVRWVHGRGSFRFDERGQPTAWSGTIQDITSLQERERELLVSRQRVRALAARREREREQERAHLAREVHDELGQHLTALRLCAHRIQRLANGDVETLARAVFDLKAQLDETGATVHSLLSQLRAAVLEFGLTVAVEWLCSEFEARHDTAVLLDNRVGDAGLSQDQTAAIFRTLQEALNNVARHAGAGRVGIRLWLDEAADEVALRVEDDGRGFDPQEVRQRRTFGLMGMRERALALGGIVRVNSGRGDGTVVTLRIPRRPAGAGDDEQEEVVA